MVPVQVIDGTVVKWENNTIYGGTQQGVSLPTASVAPEIPDYSKEIQSIREKAGVRW